MTTSRISLLGAGLLPLLALIATGCTGGNAGEDLRPSLTMFRIGEAVQEDYEDDVVVPEDWYIPGIVEGPQDFAYEDEGSGFRSSRDLGALTDLSAMGDLEDPEMLDKHKGTYAYSRLPGDLVVAEDDLFWKDVQQGAIGDCYFAAALTAVLYADDNRDVRDGMIRPITNNSGAVTHFAVRFYDAWGKPQDVEIDADIVRRSGKPLYIRSADSLSTGEEWAFSLVEKGYAKWHGGFEKIGNGGWAGDVMQALSGSKATYRSLAALSDKSLIDGIASAVAEKRPVVAGTFGEDDGVDYTGSGVYAWHAYSVHNVAEIEGEWMVQLRNPWGSSEPSTDYMDGKDDGVFFMKLADFRRLYQGITYGGGFRDDTTAPGTLTDLELVEVLGTSAIVRFTATGDDGKVGLAASYDVRVSSSPITPDNFYSADRVDAASPQAPGAVETIEVPVTGTPTYVAIRVEDESGNISALSKVLEIGSAPVATAQSFDFESGSQDWVTTGLWHRTDIESASGSYAFWFGDEDTISYNDGARPQGSLTSPVIDLAGMQSPSLYWEQLLDVEAGESFDLAVVEVATSGSSFSDWSAVWSKQSLSGSWQVIDASLAPYAGQRIQIRFRFDATDDQGNDGLGWFVDDVLITD